jgi:hypothetical protein
VLKVNMSMNFARLHALLKIAVCRRTTPCNIPLFKLVDRVRAVLSDFELTEADAPTAARGA